MALPFFYSGNYDSTKKEIILEEDTSRHIVQVLRMKIGSQLNLTDGKGTLMTCEVTGDHKKHCTVKVFSTNELKRSPGKVIIAISLLKNPNRFEWFLEKATEIGVTEIFPLICDRTEKERFRNERMQGICISAMLQSQQVWLPVLHEPVRFEELLTGKSGDGIKLIAHCDGGEKKLLSEYQISKSSNCLIAIGPEGDFTKEEIELAIKNNYFPVSLGDTRLRSETAGVVAATLLRHI